MYVFLGTMFSKKWAHRCASVFLIFLVAQVAILSTAPKSKDNTTFENLYNNQKIGLLKLIPLKVDTPEDATAALLNFDKKVRAPAQIKSN